MTETLEIRLLLEALSEMTDYDFRAYHPSTLTRRIHHRKTLEKFETITQLTDAVIHNEQIRLQLIDDFSIPVTEMFRDPSFFKCLREEILPQFYDQPLKIWHAGCATGEEVLSMAILLHELGLHHTTTIYATDMNERLLKIAKRGAYPLYKMPLYTKNYFASGGKMDFSTYFTTDHNDAYFTKNLLRNVHFAQHNLVTDQSFNEFDIILCRNVMIYFSPNLQRNVHHLFFSSLKQNGYLALGNKESLAFSSYEEYYTQELKHEQIFQKK